MSEHIFLPGVKLGAMQLLPEYKDWLSTWLSEVESDIENADVSSSMCVQGAMSEIALYGSPQTDWLGVMDTYLTDADKEGKPIAYSERYGKRLYRFTQWLQSEVHAIHARWWMEQVCSSPFVTSVMPYGKLIQDLVQPDGWIYNPKVSPTLIKTRMKSEYLMSMAMGLQILHAFELIKDRQERFEATLSSVPLTGYLSAEYFRLQSLGTLQSLELAPVNLHTVLEQCEVDEGYCDFSIAGKVDDYMGTAKRSSRDFAVHSPLSSLHAYAIASAIGGDLQEAVRRRLVSFGRYLLYHPLDIPAFKIRDLEIPFGSDVTPLEILAASSIVALSADQTSNLLV